MRDPHQNRYAKRIENSVNKDRIEAIGTEKGGPDTTMSMEPSRTARFANESHT